MDMHHPLDDEGPMTATKEWWRDAVIYQIYPRSFADGNGDGTGDFPGIIKRLPAIKALGVDAIWYSPFYKSPQADAGYDVADYCDVDPIFGTLDDFDRMIETANALGLRIIVDVVPNHTSSEHAWFKAAVASTPGSRERERYIFRDGKGENGELPPNNWKSMFGGPAWTRIVEADGTPGQWYLHMFDTGQPDVNWENDEVRDLFDDVFRFWMRRGVSGFRIDVAHALLKAPGLPDWKDDGEIKDPGPDGTVAPTWEQPGVHDIFRRWLRVLREERDDTMLCAEAWVNPPSELAKWVRHDEMQQAFNFVYCYAEWAPAAQRAVITDSLAAFGGVGAASTWVLSNHDVIRPASRLSLPYPDGGAYDLVPGAPIDDVLGRRRARAAAHVMLSLPGAAYIYQGEELGLPEVVDIDPAERQDPTFSRTEGQRLGRDGCRVPIPWEQASPAFGYSDSGASWITQPPVFGELARDAQAADPHSFLSLYTHLLAERKAHGLGSGDLIWNDSGREDVLSYTVNGISVYVNFGAEPYDLPAGKIVSASEHGVTTRLEADQAAWVAS